MKLFRELWSNDDVAQYKAGVDVLEGRYQWLERGLLAVGTPDTRASAAPVVEKQDVAVGA